MNAPGIFALERPDPDLMKVYLLRALLTGPGVIFFLPWLFFRYRTLRYKFDEEGVHMRVGVLSRREVNLTYARIQDIHLHSGIIQRWFGLADLQIQTASGASGAEMVIEGFKNFEAIRDFLYSRMRGARGLETGSQPAVAPEETAGPGDREMVELLHGIRDELRQVRQNLAPPAAP